MPNFFIGFIERAREWYLQCNQLDLAACGNIFFVWPFFFSPKHYQISWFSIQLFIPFRSSITRFHLKRMTFLQHFCTQSTIIVQLHSTILLFVGNFRTNDSHNTNNSVIFDEHVSRCLKMSFDILNSRIDDNSHAKIRSKAEQQLNGCVEYSIHFYFQVHLVCFI